MKIKNKRNRFNYVNFKIGGIAKKVMIPGGKMIDIPLLTNKFQIVNIKDFNIGFLEIVDEVAKPVEKAPEKVEAPKAKKKKATKKKKKKTEDSLDKVEKEVKDYTDNKDNK